MIYILFNFVHSESEPRPPPKWWAFRPNWTFKLHHPESQQLHLIGSLHHHTVNIWACTVWDQHHSSGTALLHLLHHKSNGGFKKTSFHSNPDWRHLWPHCQQSRTCWQTCLVFLTNPCPRVQILLQASYNSPPEFCILTDQKFWNVIDLPGHLVTFLISRAVLDYPHLRIIVMAIPYNAHPGLRPYQCQATFNGS